MKKEIQRQAYKEQAREKLGLAGENDIIFKKKK